MHLAFQALSLRLEPVRKAALCGYARVRFGHLVWLSLRLRLRGLRLVEGTPKALFGYRIGSGAVFHPGHCRSSCSSLLTRTPVASAVRVPHHEGRWQEEGKSLQHLGRQRCLGGLQDFFTVEVTLSEKAKPPLSGSTRPTTGRVSYHWT